MMIGFSTGGVGLADCRFQLLGSLKITFDNEELTSMIPGKKAKLLLVYLVLAMDIPQSRKQIAFHFWPDSTEKQALSSLRKLLHDLRECLAQIYVNVLGKLISILESQREYSSAIFYANKLIVHHKFSEDSYRTLMRLFALNKDVAGVTHIYEQLCSALQTDSG